MDHRTALVTGASSGIGAAYARRLAADGADLILVARREAALQELAAALRARHGCRVDVIAADLARPGAGTDLADRVAALGRAVDVLVNNAGFGAHGDLAGADLPRLLEMVQLNCTAVVELSGVFLPGMAERGRGVIVNVASTAAFQPVPHMAVYGASKAFVLSFSEALWVETRGTGVQVLAVCPGPTSTEFFDVVGTGSAAAGQWRTPEQVVDTAERALRRRRPSVVVGPLNALLALGSRLTPRGLTARLSAGMVSGGEPVAAGR